MDHPEIETVTIIARRLAGACICVRACMHGSLCARVRVRVPLSVCVCVCARARDTHSLFLFLSLPVSLSLSPCLSSSLGLLTLPDAVAWGDSVCVCARASLV